jgi:hypothetical protein
VSRVLRWLDRNKADHDVAIDHRVANSSTISSRIHAVCIGSSIGEPEAFVR